MSNIAYEALFREGPWHDRRIMVVDEKLLEEIIVLEDEPAVTELLAELDLGDPDPVRFEYMLLGFSPRDRAFLYVPKSDIRPEAEVTPTM